MMNSLLAKYTQKNGGDYQAALRDPGFYQDLRAAKKVMKRTNDEMLRLKDYVYNNN